jgi:hypothetical protein
MSRGAACTFSCTMVGDSPTLSATTTATSGGASSGMGAEAGRAGAQAENASIPATKVTGSEADRSMVR